MYQLIFVVFLIVLGYVVGSLVEKKHYRSIREREGQTLHLNVSSLMKNPPFDPQKVSEVRLVSGSAVISVDYFKRVLAGLINLFGGAIVSYETLLDRARREATLRMKAQAENADFIINARIETANIGGSAGKGVGCVEAFAYGTAVYLKK